MFEVVPVPEARVVPLPLVQVVGGRKRVEPEQKICCRTSEHQCDNDPAHLNLPMLSRLSALTTPTFWRQSPISTSSAPSSLPTLHLLELVKASVASLRRDSGEGRK